MRGARQPVLPGGLGHGIIPACAGSTDDGSFKLTAPRDHPRVCGEHAAIEQDKMHEDGSSPRVRGAPLPASGRYYVPGIIPARAGSTSPGRHRPKRCRDHPRACGEHPTACSCITPTSGSSPRVRGAPAAVIVDAECGGIIPACAGSTRRRSWSTCGARDHPRVCGEHCAAQEG